MGIAWPILPEGDGDAPSRSPHSEIHSLLGANAAGATRRLTVDADRNLNVNVQAATGIEASAGILTRGAQATVTAATITTIATHTVATNTLYLDGFVATGQYDADWTLVIDNVTKITFQTSEQDRTARHTFPTAQPIAIGSIIDVKVNHHGPVATTGSFNATIIGHERT